MSVLIGMNRGELLSLLLEMAPERESRTIAHEREFLLPLLEEGRYRTVILHADLFQDAYPWEWLSPVRERQPQAKIIVVPGDTVYDSLWLEVLHRLAEGMGIATAPIGCSAKETVRWIVYEWYGEAVHGPSVRSGPRGIVVTAWSAAAKDGATSIAANTALALARHTSLKIGLLDLNLKNPEVRIHLQLSAGNRSNLSLRPKLQTGALSVPELLEETVTHRKTPNLHILPGTFRRDTALDVSPEMVETLFDVCRSAFDITLVDVSSVPDNAATVCGVRTSDVRWLVVQNSVSSYLWNWNEWFECYWKYCGLALDDISVVLNRFKPEGDKPVRVASALGMSIAAIIPNVGDGIGLKALRDGIPLYDAAPDETFAEAIHTLANPLSLTMGGSSLTLREKPRKNGLASLLSGLF